MNIEQLLGSKVDSDKTDLVATQGGDLLDGSRVAAVISPMRQGVFVFS